MKKIVKNILVRILVLAIISQSALISFSLQAIAHEAALIKTNVGVVAKKIFVSGSIEFGKTNTPLTLLILKPNTDMDDIQMGDVVHIGQTIANTIDTEGNPTFMFEPYKMNDELISGEYILKITGTNLLSVTTAFDYCGNIIEYFVSTEGNDENVGSFEMPFKTIQKAKSAIYQLKQLNNGNLSSDAVVYIRGGDYCLENEPVIFNSIDSGNNGFTITYKNYPNEEPRFIAGAKLTNWQLDNGAIYKTKIPANKMFYTMYENGLRSVPSRYPHTGYNKTSGVGSKNQFGSMINDIPTITEYNDLEAMLWPGGPTGEYAWFEDAMPITNILRADAQEFMFDETEGFDDDTIFPLNSSGVNDARYEYSNVHFVKDGTNKLLELKGNGNTQDNNYYLRRLLPKTTGDFEYEVRVKRQGSTNSGRIALYIGKNQLILLSSILSTIYKDMANPNNNITLKLGDCIENTYYTIKVLLKYDDINRQYTNYDIWVDGVSKATNLPLSTPLENLSNFLIASFYTTTLGNTEDNKLYVDYYRIKCSYDAYDTVSLSNDARYVIGTGSRYYIQGAKDFLSSDYSGEFYIDKTQGWLYYVPQNNISSQSEMIMPSGYNAFEFQGASETNCVEGITLEGLTITGTDRNSSGVYLNNAKNITISKCKINNIGFRGIYAYQKVENCTFTSNEISNIGETGIQLYGKPYTLTSVNGKNKIINNHIYNIGQINGHGSGVHLYESAGNYIANNSIHHSRRYAIAIAGTRTYLMEQIGNSYDGVTVTQSNINDFINSRDNIIEYNDTYSCISDSQDCGPINTWSVGINNIIRYNIVRDSDVPFSIGVGIYLDDGSDYATVEGNLIYNLNKNGNGMIYTLIMAKGVGNTINNNIVANNDESTLLHTIAMGGLPTNDITFTKNIFYNNGNTVYGFGNWQENRLKTTDYNLFYNPATGMNFDNYLISGVIKEEAGSHNLTWWKTINNYQYDQHSIVSDPLFIDATNNDFRLSHNSPAYRLGIKDIYLQNIGLRADYPYSDYDDALKTVFIKKAGEDVNSGSISVISGTKSQLEITARTQKGYIYNPHCTNIVFESDDNNIVTINNQGEITAVKEGITTIRATVNKNGIALTTPLQIVVKKSGTEADVAFYKDLLNTEIIDNLCNFTDVSAVIKINNELGTTVPLNLFLVHYDAMNKIVQLKTKLDLELLTGDNSFSLNLTNQQFQNGDKVKLFGWQNSSLKPLFDSKEVMCNMNS